MSVGRGEVEVGLFEVVGGSEEVDKVGGDVSILSMLSILVIRRAVTAPAGIIFRGE